MLPMDVLQICYAKAAERNLPAAHVAAIIDVESRGVVYGPTGDHLPMILFEPHIFYRRVSGPARDEAVKLKLASKAPNKRLYPKSQAGRWQQIADTVALLKRHKLPVEAAAESASYGVGQVMGYHWKSLGYLTFDHFYKTMVSGAAGQIDIMLKYIEVNGLEDELRDGRWPAFFRGYNGPAWEKGGYGQKIAKALALYGGTAAKPDGMLRMGAKGARVRELQALLNRVPGGMQVKVDGDFGPSTKKAVSAFQMAKGITVDGVVGPQTQDALAQYRQGSADKPGAQKPTEVKEVVEGGGTIAGGVVVETLQNKVDEATSTLQQIDGFQPWLGYGLAALSVIALALAAYGAYRAVMGWRNSLKTVEV